MCTYIYVCTSTEVILLTSRAIPSLHKCHQQLKNCHVVCHSAVVKSSKGDLLSRKKVLMWIWTASPFAMNQWGRNKRRLDTWPLAWICLSAIMKEFDPWVCSKPYSACLCVQELWVQCGGICTVSTAWLHQLNLLSISSSGFPGVLSFPFPVHPWRRHDWWFLKTKGTRSPVPNCLAPIACLQQSMIQRWCGQGKSTECVGSSKDKWLLSHTGLHFSSQSGSKPVLLHQSMMQQQVIKCVQCSKVQEIHYSS